MAGWDRQQTYYSDLGLAAESNAAENNSAHKKQFREFIRNYRDGPDFIYRNQIVQNYNLRRFYIEVELGHLQGYSQTLCQRIRRSPVETIPLFEEAAKDAISMFLGLDISEVHPIQVQIRSGANPIDIRRLNSEMVSRLVQIPGIIISASKPEAKATTLHLECKTCQDSKIVTVSSGLGGAKIPRMCQKQTTDAETATNCGMDPYQIVPDKGKYIDQQTMKLQEAPETVPTGELPRSVLLACNRYLVGRVVPGTRVTVHGIYTLTHKSNKRQTEGSIAIQTPYIQLVGIEVEEDGQGRVKRTFTPEEEAEFLKLSRSNDVFERLSKNIAPSIFGSADMKKALACLLFGGSRKMLPDGMRLRGDINVLLLGDPSTAKSQMLKFIEKVAPVCVYTSGKGSSAAGLTASVVREKGSGEFHLEGGAMVLADGGIVCIDEFDKMSDSTRSILHEAMEQQTVSIAKAGIICSLNARTSILAAANPIESRYNPRLSVVANIQLPPTLLSRFDLIYLVLDKPNEVDDRRLAKHLVSLYHEDYAQKNTSSISIETLTDYISYARMAIHPQITEEAGRRLTEGYVEMRRMSSNKKTITATPRQLESLIRLAEAHARMRYSEEVEVVDVDEAIRLMRVATQQAATDPRTGTIDMDLIATGQSAAERSETADLAREIRQLISGRQSSIKMNALMDLVREKIRAEASSSEVRDALKLLVEDEALQESGDRTNPTYKLLSA
eukprot:GFYU01012862.1.p1 GENE.GFYU01012862.1~~GFYU01012862.1.p1  ORF type:complete len:727 (-),score=252.45 GFYU01012862.1:299-2479(-)